MTPTQREFLYDQARAAKAGQEVQCPNCAKPFKKASYQQAFCCNSGAGNCKDAYWNAVRSPNAERSAKDYAIEHAEYLADGADNLIEAYNLYGSARMNLEEAEEGSDLEELEQDLEHAKEYVSEALSRLRSLTHDFRKRAASAKVGGNG